MTMGALTAVNEGRPQQSRPWPNIARWKSGLDRAVLHDRDRRPRARRRVPVFPGCQLRVMSLGVRQLAFELGHASEEAVAIARNVLGADDAAGLDVRQGPLSVGLPAAQ